MANIKIESIWEFRGTVHSFPTVIHTDGLMVVVSGPIPLGDDMAMRIATSDADAASPVAAATCSKILAEVEQQMLAGTPIDPAQKHLAVYLTNARNELLTDLPHGLKAASAQRMHVILISGPAPQMLMEICLEKLPALLEGADQSITVAFIVTSKAAVENLIPAPANAEPIIKTIGCQTYVFTHGNPTGTPKILALGSDKSDVKYYEQFCKPAGFRCQIERRLESSYDHEVVAYLKAARVEIFSTMAGIIDEINADPKVAANPDRFMLIVFCPAPIMAAEACAAAAKLMRVPIAIGHCVL